MTTGGIVDLLDTDSLKPVILQAGESGNITAQLKDPDGANIAEASLLTLTLTLYNEATAAVINSRNAQDVKDANGGTVGATGAVTMRLDNLDNVIVSASVAAKELEAHIARFQWTWNDGVGTRYGAEELRYYVQQLVTVS